MILSFGLHCLIILITEQQTKFLICEFSVAFDEMNCCEPPIKIGWFCLESIAGIRSKHKQDDAKTYIKGALKHSLAAKNTSFWLHILKSRFYFSN